MTRPDRAATYVAVLRLPGAPRAFAAATLGRLSYASLSLSLLVTVEHATGSYAAAGTALAVFALASVAMPAKSRLIDRHGQRRLLPVLSVAFAGALLAIVGAAVLGTTATWTYLALAVMAGVAAPPLGPSMRALWAALTPDPAMRQRAYSLDGVVEEALYAIGPLLVGVILTVSSGATALAVTAALNVAGSTALATSELVGIHAPAGADPSRSSLLGPLRRRGFALLALAMLGIGIGGGPLEVAILARTQQEGHPNLAGYLIAALAVGSACGGLLWGHLHHHRPASAQLGPLVVVMTVGTVAAALAPTLPLLAVALAVTGAVGAPAFIVSFLAADDLVPESGRTEATTWVSTATNAGVAFGAAGAGVISDSINPDAALLAGAAALGLTAVVIFATRTRLNPATTAHPPATRTERGNAGQQPSR
jgi:MFS family permease